MYQTDYFIRFVADAAQARRDMQQKVSFAMYLEFDSKREARAFQDEHNVGGCLRKCSDGKFRFALSGLCGFGPYGDEADAERAAIDRRGYNGVEYPAFAIFEGRYVGQADAADGDMFRPIKLVKVVNL